MLMWVLETNHGEANVWWSDSYGGYSPTFSDATVYYAETKNDLPSYPNATWVAIDTQGWMHP